MDERRYWAFLSYSHADRAWGRWLHRALETWTTPARLVGRPTAVGPAPRRFSPIFRDREELAVDVALADRIREALAGSAYLIVLCSPAAARSAWVEKEIVEFKRLHGDERVLAVIVGGSGDEAYFPPALRAGADPIAADLRPGQDGRRLALLKLMARMLEVGLDDLVRRDLQRRQRRWAAATAAMAGVAATTTGLAILAFTQRDEARHQRARAEGQVEFMLGDLTRRLKPTGRLDLLDAVGAQALAYYAAEAPRGLDADALGRRARVLHLLGDLRDQRGDLAGASKDFEAAARATGALLEQKPDDGGRIFNHAQSLYYLGGIARRRGRTDEAQRAFLGYRALALTLVKLDPGRDDWRAEVAYADENLGSLWQDDGRDGLAAAAFSQALAVDEVLAARAPGDRDRQSDLAGVYGWRAKAEVGLAKPGTGASLAPAYRDLLAERAIDFRLLARQSGDNLVRFALVTNRLQMAGVDRQLGRTAQAAAELESAAAEVGALSKLEPDNASDRQQAAVALIDLARARLAQGDIGRAEAASAAGLAAAEALARKDPSVQLWRGYLLGGARIVAIRVAVAKARSATELRAALAPAQAEADRLLSLAASRPPNLGLARVTADALLLAGDAEAASGRIEPARETWARALAICGCTAAKGTPETPSRISPAGLEQDLADARRLSLGGAETAALLARLRRRWLEPYLW